MKATKNENVVYILGAGFSAQFGLPVMNNFLEKSKDMYAIKDELKYRIQTDIDFFKNVYSEIDKLRRCKDFYEADMTNIEEILSLFDMGKILGSESKSTLDFKKFISAVIKYYTPTEYRIGTYNDFEMFVEKLFRITKKHDPPYADHTLPHYSILSFNYDLLLESLLECFNKKYFGRQVLRYTTKLSEEPPREEVFLPYIKLHGTVDDPETIVPPTWHKLQDEQNENWKFAGTLLMKANHIRIIGYSLPVTDNYLKYFLKWGAAHENNLKSIDVICLDDNNGTVKKRYRDFIHNKLNFFNKTTGEYLEEVKKGIEEAHEHLFLKSSKNTNNNTKTE